MQSNYTAIIPPWDRPNSNRLMGPPIFDALLVITYTFSMYMLHVEKKKCLKIYTLSKSCVPNSENFHFLPFLDRKSVKEVCSDDGDSFSRLIIIFLIEIALLVFAQNLLVFN